jgi:hypothetical protein
LKKDINKKSQRQSVTERGPDKGKDEDREAKTKTERQRQSREQRKIPQKKKIKS